MAKAEYENELPLDDSETEEIARLITEGYTQGRCDAENIVAWELRWNKWKA